MTTEGRLLSIDGKQALRFERRYRHPRERVWRAITEPSEMAKWFPSNVDGDRVAGAELRFMDDAQRAAAVEAGEPARVEGPMFRGSVITFDPPKVFAFTWGGEVLRFELLHEGDDTVLVFTQLLSHPSVAARNGAGWHACFSGLDQVLGQGPAEDDADWVSVYQEYLERVGPALGVPSGDSAMTWERSTHVDADRVHAVTSEPAEIAAWGGRERSADPVRWDIEPTEHGSLYHLTVDAVGDDAELAATWHALLIQLDMYLAAGQLVPVDAKQWIAAYEDVLSSRALRRLDHA